MIQKIVVYVRNTSVSVPTGLSVRGPVDHPCLDSNITSTEKIMPESDRLVLDTVNEFADEKGLRVEVCDVSTARGRLRASLKGIDKTPVVEIGEKRITCGQRPETLRSKLESSLVE